MRSWARAGGFFTLNSTRNAHTFFFVLPQTIQIRYLEPAFVWLSSNKALLCAKSLYQSTLRSALPSKRKLFQSHCNTDLLNRALTSSDRVEPASQRGGKNRCWIKQVLDKTVQILLQKKCRRRGGHVTVCFKDGNCVSAQEWVSFTTFNILAPIYKRINGDNSRESQFRELWLCRNQGILDMLLWKRSSVICLQEFWLGNQELVDMYQHRLGDAGYETYKLGRTNNRGDGLFTAVRKDHFKSEVGGVQQEVLIVNTHLLFPHNSNFCLVRLRQAYKILEYLETFKAEHKLPPIPIILCGDWNGSKRGIVYKFLRSQGFISSYDTAHHYTDSDADAHRWVSHRNHRGNICGVDFIWLLNPNKDRKPLRTSWMEAVFGIIKFKLREAGRNGVDAFGFFKSEYSFNDHVTLTEFGQALERLGLTEQFSEGLTTEEIEDLMVTADLDGNGIMDNEEFQKMMVAQSIELSPITVLQGKTAPSEKCLAPYFHGTGNKETAFWQHQCGSSTVEHNQSLISKQNMESVPGASLVGSKVDSKSKDDSANLQGSDIGFDVADASFFPREAEQAIWPENYLLSDHAPLTAVLAPWSTLK